MVRAAEAQRPQQAARALSFQSHFPLLLALVYLALLVVPWVLTCVVARNPSLLARRDPDAWPPSRVFYLDYSALRAAEVLDTVAVVVSLPVLSALLARAAVVFSQRRRGGGDARGRKLTVRQLLALADRGWWDVLLVFRRSTSSPLLVLGFALLLLAFALPLVRSNTVTHVSAIISPVQDWDSYLDDHYYERMNTLIGYSPGPRLLKRVSGPSLITQTRSKLQTTSGGVETNLWPYCNDENAARYYNSSCGYGYAPYDMTQSSLSNYWEAINNYIPGGTGSSKNPSNGSAPMFASTLRAGSTTGVVNSGYALGLKSGTTCEAVTVEEVRTNCIAAAAGPGATSGWNTSLVIPGQIRVDICLPVHESTSIWDRADSFPGRPQLASEDMYIGIQELNASMGDNYNWGCSSCFGTNLSPAGLYMHCQANTTLAYFQLGNLSTRGVPSPFLNETPSSFDIPDGDTQSSSGYPADPVPQAPLMATAQAMFGNDSWLAAVGSFLDLTDSAAPTDQTSYLPFVQLVCQARPLANADKYFRGSFYDYCDDASGRLGGSMSPAQLLAAHVRAFFSMFQQAEQSRAVLNTGAFFANSYMLSAALAEGPSPSYYSSNRTSAVYRHDGLETLPVVPVVGTAALVVVSVLVGLQAAGVLGLVGYAYSARVWTRTLDAFAMVRVGAQLDAVVGAAAAAGEGEQLWARDGLVDPGVVAGDGVELGMLPPPYSPSGGGPRTAGPPGDAASATAAAAPRPSSSSSPVVSSPAHAAGREQQEASGDAR